MAAAQFAIQVTRHARMPAACGCPLSADARLARMPADADARLVRMLAMTGFAESGRRSPRSTAGAAAASTVCVSVSVSVYVYVSCTC